MKRKETAQSPLAERLRELRVASGMTQQEVADHLQLKRSTYAYYETGAISPSFETLQRIAAEYLVSVDFLLDKEPAPAPLLTVRQGDPEMDAYSPLEGAARMRSCDKEERAFLSMLRRMGAEEKEKLYFYGLDLLAAGNENGSALADVFRNDVTERDE